MNELQLFLGKRKKEGCSRQLIKEPNYYDGDECPKMGAVWLCLVAASAVSRLALIRPGELTLSKNVSLHSIDNLLLGGIRP